MELLSSQAQYLRHLGPVWDTLPAHVREADAALVASAMDLGRAVGAGHQRVAYLEHGAGQPYSGAAGYPGGVGRQHVGLFLSPNSTAAAADRAAYPRATVVEVGGVGLELLPAREPGPPAVAVSFHWECSVCPESRSAFTWYRRTLPALAERFTVLGHAHPKAARQLERAWRRMGVEWVPSFDDVCRRADAYVCDNSSTLFEFASTGRPVVVLNAPWYRRNVHHGLRFWQAASVGVQVDEPAELLGALERALDDSSLQRHLREQALRVAYTAREGAAAAAARALEAWLA